MCVRATRRWRTEEEEEEERKNPRITKESLRRICKEQKLYITPHLNDVLYLHYKGYSKIENLDEYTGLKCLWLENNGIDKIENLDNQKDLRNLYLHNNLIKEIENLEGACPLLDSLNLCHNSVSRIKNLSRLEHLHTLHISHNRLQDFADVEHLKECKELSCVDLQHNWLDDPAIVEIFEAMPSLRVLYLTGNPVVKKIPSYRKNLTVRCKKLTYLDDRPVFPKDRAAAEAWSEGGLEAEKACRQKWAEEERAKIDASVKGLLALRDKAKAAKFRAEMEELATTAETGKKEREDEEDEEDEGHEEDEEEEEEEDTEDEEDEENEENDKGETSNYLEPPSENLEAGDSGQIAHDGIVFPWNLEPGLGRRNGNELGEGGRSLIVELPDPDQSETKRAKCVGRKGPVDPETKNKLQDALASTERVQEKDSAEDGPSARETKPEAEAVAEEPLGQTPPPSPEAPDVSPDSKAVEETSADDGDTEKGTLDNLIKEKRFAYEKYFKTVEEEILPNIAHFSFGRKPLEEEKSLASQIEESLRLEMEERKREKRTSREPEGTLAEETEGNAAREAETRRDAPRREEMALFEEGRLIDEKEAAKVLDFGVKVVEELRGIGRFPLEGKEAEDSSSEGEFQDPEEESPVVRVPDLLSSGASKLESQESEEYYSIPADDGQEFSRKGQTEEAEELGSPGLDGARREEEATEETKGGGVGPSSSEGAETLVRHDAEGGSTPDEGRSGLHKRDIKSSIELQIVNEKDVEESGPEED